MITYRERKRTVRRELDLEARLLNVPCFIVLHWNHENVFQNYRRKLIQKGKREEPNVDAER